MFSCYLASPFYIIGQYHSKGSATSALGLSALTQGGTLNQMEIMLCNSAAGHSAYGLHWGPNCRATHVSNFTF